MNKATTFQAPTIFRTLYVLPEGNGLYRVADRRGVPETILTPRRWNEATNSFSVPATKLSLSVAMEVAEDLAYEDYQAEESAKAERAADPQGLFL